MPATHSVWTVDMLDALEEDGQRYEIIDGKLFVTPAPSEEHQLVVTELAARLVTYLRGSRIGRVTLSPSDVRRSDRTRNRVQPDVLVVRLTDGKRPRYPYDLADLLLAVEVQSPSSAHLDYDVKREIYLNGGVTEYWVINVEARNVSRWRGASDPGEVLSARIEWRPAGASAPMIIGLPEFFDTALT